jgi:hypothetical protein
MKTREEIEVQWQNFTRKLLVGKTVRHVRYMNDDEMEYFMWDKKPVVIIFTDGTMLVPQSDDEGNDGGALFYYNKKEKKQEVIPVIY